MNMNTRAILDAAKEQLGDIDRFLKESNGVGRLASEATNLQIVFTAIRDLAEAVCELDNRLAAAESAARSAQNAASCLANGIRPD